MCIISSALNILDVLSGFIEIANIGGRPGSTRSAVGEMPPSLTAVMPVTYLSLTVRYRNSMSCNIRRAMRPFHALAMIISLWALINGLNNTLEMAVVSMFIEILAAHRIAHISK